MPFRRLFRWFKSIFSRRKVVRLGLYGPPNAGKTTLANKISMDWTGEPVGKVSEIPHETREVQKKERVVVSSDGQKIIMNLLDMPGIATKIDYEEFMKYGMNAKEAQQRAKEATKGVIEAIKWLEHVDTALVIMDSSKDPYTQVNITIIGNLEARDIPVIIVANKIDLKESDPERIKEAFPQHPVVEVSGLTGNILMSFIGRLQSIRGKMAIEIEFVSSEVLESKSAEEKMAYILDKIKADKILVIEESLSSQEEAMLIEATMREVSKKFPGLEISTLKEKSVAGIKEKLIKFLGGRTGGLTVVGPSKLVRKIKKEPQQISVLAGEEKKID